MQASKRRLMFILCLCLLAGCSGPIQPAESPESPGPTPVMQAGDRHLTHSPGDPANVLPEAMTSEVGHLSPTLTMRAPRAAHTATLLADGRVLLTGGFRQQGTAEIPIASAEIYDPASNRFIQTGDMNEARSGHTATLLPDGQVLIAGGWGESRRTASAELYDPQTGEFTYTASMAAPRASMTATQLEDGLVLFAGGDIARNKPQLVAELYNPTTHTFLEGGSLQQGRSAHTATRLEDGTVLLVGGRTSDDSVLASAEIFDPATLKFTLTGSLNAARNKHAAVRLQDGNVLVLGGSSAEDWKGKYTSAEIYDTKSGTFMATTDLNSERFKLPDAAVLLDDGSVLVGGGSQNMELFDPQKQQFIVNAALDDAYYFAVLTHLQDGRVLISGGYNASIAPSDRAWIYQPGAVTTASEQAPACPITVPELVKPPEDAAVQGEPGFSYYYVNEDRSLWASAWWYGAEGSPLQAGDEGNKVGWFRPANVELEISGQRLDGEAPPLEAYIPCCYPTRFQATGLNFPTAGCWEVNARAGDKQLAFTVWVDH